ncbi:Toxin RTX-I translocation ATP-binding protein [Vibrio mimicus VM603]|uniref:Toxin RTX-I translocation ATP-binding protein n=2 Tax=Vibrio mimicus TaxID=674 RepID=D2YCM9_VIBMI|nr:Toxin RTX-I translocation ATP-binding protein [Vibrio mimicus VM603]
MYSRCVQMKLYQKLDKCVDTLSRMEGFNGQTILLDESYTYKKRLRILKKHYKVGLKRKLINFNKLSNSEFPVIIRLYDFGYVILAGINEEKVLILRADYTSPEVFSKKFLENEWTGEVIFLKFEQGKFDFSWFVSEFLKFKLLFGKVLIYSFILQVLALINPLFFQVIMDKVLVHGNYSTLDILVVILATVSIYEVLLKGLREYLFSHTTNRIDIRLGTKLFNHLLSLPLVYFKVRKAGMIVARVRELASIREFLTSSAITLCVDVVFSAIFLVVMALLSTTLVMIIIFTIPIYVVIAWATSRKLKSAVEIQFSCGAKNTSFLTESTSGIQTIKSLSIEPAMERKWQSQVDEFAHANFKTQKITSLSNQLIQLIQKVTCAVIILVGATEVMSLRMSIGQLIAFNMLLTHIHIPLSKLVDLWQKYIQVRVGICALADIINLPGEAEQSTIELDSLRGEIIFKDVYFTYQPGQNAILSKFNLHVLPGEIIGIVGPSGSGKSTIVRLIQKLYLPSSGSIFLDGIELENIKSSSLRNKIGVVLQDNYLFNKSVRDNIASKNPTVDISVVIQAAKLAGAHEFILKLPLGYDTILSEGGESLSGGQRQRIAIARALIGEPRLLILDEATSALDDETQNILQKNMEVICSGRTVIVIAHRLSTVRNCDRIITIEHGVITEQGTHDELLARKGTYHRLWQLQKSLKHDNGELA